MSNYGFVRTFAGLAVIAGVAVTPVVSAMADAVADFYKNKRVTLVVSYGAGGSYGLYGRLVANTIGKYLPGNPTVVVQYMPGAGGVKATNYLYNAAPKDGTYVGTVFKDLAVMQALRPAHAKFDARKFNWVGRVNSYVPVIMVWGGRGIASIDDVKKRQVIMGVSGRNHHGYLLASMLNHLVGTKFKLVTGYRGAKAMNLAMESGEVDARIGSSLSLKTQHAGRVKEGKLIVITQSGAQKDAELPNVPLVNDMLTDPADRKVAEVIDSGSTIGWSILMPPGVPGDRVAAWRTAFDAVLKDDGFLAQAKKSRADINPMSGAAIAAAINRVLSYDDAVIARARRLVGVTK